MPAAGCCAGIVFKVVRVLLSLSCWLRFRHGMAITMSTKNSFYQCLSPYILLNLKNCNRSIYVKSIAWLLILLYNAVWLFPLVYRMQQMKKGKQNSQEEKIKLLEKEMEEEEKLSPEEVKFGQNYPIAELIAYATNKLDNDKKVTLEKMFKENIVLRTNYEGIDFIIRNFGISSEDEYIEFIKNTPKYE